MSKLAGIIIPAVTPFDDDEKVDLAALADNYQRWAATRVAGFMALGTNGEFRSLDDAESHRVIEAAAQHKGDKTLIAGIGRESVHHTLAFMDSLSDQQGRVDYLSVLTPNYFAKQMDSCALADFYTTIADAAWAPVLIYVIPGSANGVTLAPGALSELADHPNIAGIKDTSPAMLMSYLLAAGDRDDFTILAGSLGNIMTNLAYGAPGGVVSVANYLPEECARLLDLYATDPQLAWRYYRLLQSLAASSGAMRGVPSVKAAMNALGYRAGRPRRPLMALEDSLVETIKQNLVEGIERLAAFEAPEGSK